ncbi:MAG: YigZ family protein [Bacilli bacterium]|nr:YigZ family protein [Bacilli bacterium]
MIIESNCTNEIIINKSKFITYMYKIKNKNEFLNYYNELKNIHKDATHICYSYIIDTEVKYFDDKEPSGTAGMPIYDVLKKNNLNYIVCFVVRYFGGIKLGASGLTRAYSNCTSLCLKKTNIIKLEKLYKIKLIINYQDLNIIENILDNKDILEKDYQNDITLIILVNDDKLQKINKYNFNYEILDNNYI